MKMKRTLSLVLALVMVLGTFGTVFAETVVETPETNVAAGALLKELGVLVGNAEGDLMLEQGLKRQDTAVLVAKLMGEFDAAKEFPTVKGEIPTYEDIEDHFYLPFLAWAQANKTFVGHTPARFGFDEEMTVQQFAKVLLTVLGYEVGPEADVKYEDVVQKVFDLKIIDTTDEMGFTRGVMAMMTYNALNTKMKDSDQTLAEFLDIEMPEVEAPEAEELKIEKVYTENLAEVVVELSNAKLVENMEALTNKNNYRINGVTVENVDVVGNELVLTLVPYGEVVSDAKVLTKGATHTLTIRNVKGISQSEKFVARDLAVPTVENVEFLGTHGIKVTTSEPVMNPQERNFRLDDKRTSMVIEQYGRELILTPYYSQKFDVDAEKLVINELEDFAGYKSATVFEDIKELENDAAPMVEKAYRNGNKLTLVFDRDIYNGSVAAYSNRRAEGNVSFVERRVTLFAEDAKKIDTNVAEYVFEREIPRDAVITVEGVQNHNLKSMDRQDVETMLFEDDYAPVIISASKNVEIVKHDNDRLKKYSDDDRLVALNNGFKTEKATSAMTITFDKDIYEFEKDSNGNYPELKEEDFFNLYELDVTRRGETAANEVVINAEVVASDKVELTFNKIKVNNPRKDYDYVLEVRNFSDKYRNRMEVEYLDFEVVRPGTKFDVDGKIDVKQVGRNVEVRINFNYPVNKAAAENANNYFFGETGKELLVDDAIVERNGTTVSLIIRNEIVNDIKAKELLEISPAVTDIDGNVINGSRFFNLRTEKRLDQDPVVKPAEAITYINNGVAEEATSATGNTKLDADKVLAVNVTTGNNQFITVKSDETAEVRLLKDGKLEKIELVKKDAVLKLGLDLSKSAEYKIQTTLDGKVTELVVNVQDTDATGTLSYKNSNKVETVKLDGDYSAIKELVLPVKDLADVSKDDFKVDTKAQKVELELAGSNTQLIVTITAENKTKEVYTVKLKAGTGMTTDSTVKEGDLTGIENPELTTLKFNVYGMNDNQNTLENTKTWMNTTYGVDFKLENLKVEGGKLLITGELLSPEDWMEVKSRDTDGKLKDAEDIDFDRPYRITLVKDDSNKIFKIAMYADGKAVIE